jgi:hypothetical protein
MSECASCQKGLRSLISRKLGRCPGCLRASAIGTIAGWTVAVAISLGGSHPLVVWVSVLVALGFTLLLLAHLAALIARMVALWATMRASAPGEIQALWPSRRVFLLSLAGAALGALLPSILGRQAAWAASGTLVGPRDILAAAYPLTCTTQPVMPAQTLTTRDHKAKDKDVKDDLVKELREDAEKFCNTPTGCKGIDCPKPPPKTKQMHCRVDEKAIAATITKDTITVIPGGATGLVRGQFTLNECPCHCV